MTPAVAAGLDAPSERPGERPALGELRFRRLLVAIDGSDSAEMALSAAVTAARRDHACLTLVAVARDVAVDAARWVAAPGCPPMVQAQADADAERVLRRAVERLPEDVSVTTLVLRGKPGPRIVAHARGGDYDAILLGARGVGRVGALAGSVSQYVLHHADIPVLVAHAPQPRG